MFKYPVALPDLSGNERKYLNECIDTEWISSKGPFVEKLEKEWAKYCGSRWAVACSSGTTALTLALAAVGVKEGDEVIVPDFTMIASAWAVSYLGAKPVFVDCGDDLNIDTKKIEAAITPKTRAIMPVHIYGRMCDMDAIERLAEGYNLFVIEDACEAHGATYQGKRAGSIGDVGCFSLFANKIISSGEGGLITTDDTVIYQRLIHLRTMLFDPKHTFLHRFQEFTIGYNYRMTNMQAAVGLAQVERIDHLIEAREKIRYEYDAKLGSLTIRRPTGSVLWMYDIVLPEEVDRQKLMDYLAEQGIETRYFFKPMKRQPAYAVADWKASKAADFSERGLYLPTHTKLNYQDIDWISDRVLQGIEMCYN